MSDPVPKISMEALAGLATGVDIVRLLVAATPSETVSDLEFRKLIFGDPEPLMAEAALLPLLGRASIVSDEISPRHARRPEEAQMTSAGAPSP